MSEEYKDEATRKAEFEAEQAEKKRISELMTKRYEHINKRVREIEGNPNKIFWSLQATGNGFFVQTDGLFNIRFHVPDEPEYKAVDNVIVKVMMKDYNINSISQHEPYKILFEDSCKGDSIREKIFKAYKCAILAYKWCRKNDVQIYRFSEKINPEFGTLDDIELLEFFKKELDKMN